MTLGDYHRAMDVLQAERGIPARRTALERFEDQHSAYQILLRYCPGLTWLGALPRWVAFAEGIAYGEEALRLAEAVDRRYDRVRASSVVGHLHSAPGGRLQQAIPVFERAWRSARPQTCRNLRHRRCGLVRPWPMPGPGASRRPRHCWSRDRASLRRTVITRPPGPGSEAYLLAGRGAEASQLAQRALALARDASRNRATRHMPCGSLARSPGMRDPPEIEPAEAHYRQAFTLAAELGMRPLQAHCHRGLGTLYAKTGQQEQARTELAAAIDLYRAMDMTFWLPQTEAALAQVIE